VFRQSYRGRSNPKVSGIGPGSIQPAARREANTCRHGAVTRAKPRVRCCQRRDAAHAAARTRHPATRTAGDGGLRWGQPSVSRGRKASALFGLPSRRDHGRLRATRYSDWVRLAPGARHFPWPPPAWNPGGGPFQPSISAIFRTGLLLAPSMPVSSSTCQDVHRGLVRPSLRR
jgi:hypothetical protein